MLFWKDENIFETQKLATSQIGLNALADYLLPFQIFRREFPGIDYHISSIMLLNNGREIDLAGIIPYIDVLQDAHGNYYYVFDGTSDLSSLEIPCGIWQLYFEFDDSKRLYSNFFNVIEDYTAKLTYANSFDFDNKIYHLDYKNIIYITNKIVADKSFVSEKIVEKGDGSKIYEYQNFADSYLFSIFGDKYLVKELSKLPMFDEVYFSDDYFSNVQIFGRANFEFSFETKTLNYKGVVKFSIDETEKTLCEENYNIHSDDWILESGFWDFLGIWKPTGIWNF